jgi:hypothetical protein
LIIVKVGCGTGVLFGVEMSLVGDVGIQLREVPNVRPAKLKIVCFSCILPIVLILWTEFSLPVRSEFGEQRHGYLENGNLGE